MDIFLIILLWIVAAICAAILARRYGRSGAAWAAMTFLFAPAILILLALGRRDARPEAR